MKCLVTGGAGFIGSWLVDRLIAESNDVIIIDDLSTGKEENINKKATFYKVKIESPELKPIFEKEKPDYVFHLAAQCQVTVSVTDPELDAKTNIIGTLNLTRCCLEHNVKKMLFSSSGGVMYGNVDTPADENNLTTPLSPYGISKQAGEQYIKFYSAFGLKYLILRYANVYGPRQDPNGEAGVVAIFSQNMLKNKPCTLYGFGNLIRDYVYVEDVVEANILGISRGENTTLNIGSGVKTSVQKLFDLMKRITKYSITPTYKSKRDGELDKSILNCSKALRILAWQYKKEFKNGIEETIKWFNKA